MHINDDSNEVQLKTKLKPTLELIIALLDQYLKNEWDSETSKHIPRMFFKNYNLLQVIDTYILLLNDEELNCAFANIAYLIYFITLCIESKQHMITEQEAVSVFQKVFILLEQAMKKGHFKNVAKLSQIGISYWYLIRTRLLPMTYKNIKKTPLSFQIQIAIVQMSPICQFYEQYLQLWCNGPDVLDEIRDSYSQQCYGEMVEYTVRLMYTYREALMINVSPNYKTAAEHIRYIQQTIKYYENEGAIFHFQALLYVLHDTIALLKENAAHFEVAKTEAEFFLASICTIKDFIENFNIKWTNCTESVFVVNTVLDLLLLTNWPHDVSK